MNKNWHPHQPSDEEYAQVKRVEEALCNEINILSREGIPVACLLTGLGMTIADLLTCQKGSEAVEPWFRAQADMIAGLQGDKH